MIGYWDLFPGLYYYRLVTRIISDTLTTNGFGHRFILLAWKYCLFSFLHFKSQILIRKVFIPCFLERTRQGFPGNSDLNPLKAMTMMSVSKHAVLIIDLMKPINLGDFSVRHT